MAMKKAEMESHWTAYHSILDQARAAKNGGFCVKAVKDARECWPHIDGMLRYGKRYQKVEFDSIEAIDIVLDYAPLLFDIESLDAVESLMASHRRFERQTVHSIADHTAEARTLMWQAHRVWDHLERHGQVREDELRGIVGDGRWRAIAGTWERMGVLSRNNDGETSCLELSTRMGQVVSAKCPSCGGVAEAPKAMFLEEMQCPQCHAGGLFVLLSALDPLARGRNR